MDEVFPSPEAAAREGDSYCRVVAVDYSPDGRHAVAFLEYSPDSRPTPYVALCERSDDGWTSVTGGSGGGSGWTITHGDRGGQRGVAWRWDPPYAEWNAPRPF